MGALTLSPADLKVVVGEPRVLDVRLGEVLGMAQPLNIRAIIRSNMARLERDGAVFTRRVKTPSARGRNGEGRPSTEYLLNERQAYRLCMFSRTERAAVVQDQMVDVFFAYRHGQLTARVSEQDRWNALDRRIAQLERLARAQTNAGSDNFVRAVTYAPPIMAMIHDGSRRRRRQRRPRFWGDIEVRSLVMSLHRQCTIDEACQRLVTQFGPDRAPSRSSLGRFWKQYDSVRGVN